MEGDDMIGYPNGKTAARSVNAQPLKQSAGGRGMSLENDLNKTNEYYLQLDKAVIHKKPTPIQIVQVDYPKRSAAKITEAYFKVPSTTDYNGVYRGKAIDFEARKHARRLPFPSPTSICIRSSIWSGCCGRERSPSSSSGLSPTMKPTMSMPPR